MKLLHACFRTAGLVALWALLAACASTRVDAPRTTEAAQTFARPDRVLVHDFVGTPADLPPGSAIAGMQGEQAPQTPQQIELGRQLGRRVADHLVTELQANGIAAQRADSAGPPKSGDGVIRGAFVTVDEGSRTKRMLIGFGAGATNLQTLVEAFVQTDGGLQSLGTTQVGAGGGKLPGVLVPVGLSATAVTAATSGTANILQERGPESIEGAAQRTAKGIAKVVVDAYRKRGWMQ